MHILNTFELNLVMALECQQRLLRIKDDHQNKKYTTESTDRIKREKD